MNRILLEIADYGAELVVSENKARPWAVEFVAQLRGRHHNQQAVGKTPAAALAALEEVLAQHVQALMETRAA